MKSLAALILLVSVSNAGALGFKYSWTQKVSIDDGRNAVPFAIACTGTAWTAVSISSAPIRRSLFVETMPSNVVGVCLSTITASASACDDNATGYELSPATGTVTSITINNTLPIYCRCRLSASCAVKGVAGFDRADIGAIYDPNWQ